MRFTGHDTTAPIDVSVYQEATSSTPTAPGVTTTGGQPLILRIGGFDDDDVTIDDAGMLLHTTITMDESSGGLGTCSSGAAFAPLLAGPTVPSAAFTLTNSEQWGALTVAIAPAPAFEVCGNGFLEGTEECDDGNTDPGDCCSASCEFEVVGTECRAAADVCDAAESCTGTSGVCPTDAFEASRTCFRCLAQILKCFASVQVHERYQRAEQAGDDINNHRDTL